MIQRLATLVVTCTVAGMLVSASVSAAGLLPVAEIYPGYNAEVTQSSSGFYLYFAGSYAHLASPFIEIATRDVIGLDGTLSDDYNVDLLAPSESTEHAGAYSAHTGFSGWTATPGTYYWQARGAVLNGFELTEYVSQVFVLRITGLGRVEPTPLPTPKPIAPSVPPAPIPPAPSSPVTQTLTASESARLIRTVITRHTGRSPRQLTHKCVQRSPVAVSCKASWISPRRMSARTLIYAGTFYFALRGGAVVSTFVGVSARYRCERHLGTRRCESKVRWH
jgi:hypothetical protein